MGYTLGKHEFGLIQFTSCERGSSFQRNRRRIIEREREREREGATAKSLIAWDYAKEVIYSMLERA